MLRRSKSARSRHANANAKDSIPDFSPRDAFSPGPKSSNSAAAPSLRQRSKSIMTPERPSTSSGPTNTQGFATTGFHVDSTKLDKRISRDDSWLVGRGRSQSRSKGPWSHQKRSSSPEVSPTSSPVIMAAAPPTRMPTGYDDIGVALGSPTRQVPMSWNSWTMGAPPPQRSARTPSSAVTTPLSSVTTSGETFHDQQAPRKQSGKWKIFGMFGRKNSEPASPAVTVSGPNDLRGPPTRAPVERSNTVSSNHSKYKPITTRSQTMPEVPVLIVPPERHQNKPPVPAVTGPLLDVEVPDVTKFDRYSVMFGSVLHQHQQGGQAQSQQQSSSNLLSRRQATVQHLKRIEDAVEEEHTQQPRARRATSPDPTGSKTFTIYDDSPALTRHLNKPHRLSPLARASTSPAYLAPPQEKYEHEMTPERPPPSIPPKDAKHSSPKSKLVISTVPQTKDQKLALTRPPFSPGESSLVLDSPVEDKNDAGREAGSRSYAASVSKPSRTRDGHRDHSSSSTLQEASTQPNMASANNSGTGIEYHSQSKGGYHDHQVQHQQQTPSTASSSVSSLPPGKRSPSIASSSAHTTVTQPSPQPNDKEGAATSSVFPSVSATSPYHLQQAKNNVGPEDYQYAQTLASSTGDLVNPNSMNPVEVSIARQISISRQQRKMFQSTRNHSHQKQQQQYQQQAPKQQMEVTSTAATTLRSIGERSLSVSSPNTGSSSALTSTTTAGPTSTQQCNYRQRAASSAAAMTSSRNASMGAEMAAMSPSTNHHYQKSRPPRPTVTGTTAAVHHLHRHHHERVGETRSSTPTVVTVPSPSVAALVIEGVDSSEGTDGVNGSDEDRRGLTVSSPLAQHRKSSRVVLETV